MSATRLRARLRREADRRSELESALRAEKELRRQASDEHQAALAGLRLRLSEVEAARDRELERLATELSQARADAASAINEARAATAAIRAAAQVSEVAPARAAKVPRGLRRIRGIGPAYQRVLEQLGVTRVEQVAAWSEQDIVVFADKLKIRPDRVTKDDWVGQAKRLEPESPSR